MSTLTPNSLKRNGWRSTIPPEMRDAVLMQSTLRRKPVYPPDTPPNALGLSQAYLTRMRQAKLLLRTGQSEDQVRAAHGGVILRAAKEELEKERGIQGNVPYRSES